MEVSIKKEFYFISDKKNMNNIQTKYWIVNAARIVSVNRSECFSPDMWDFVTANDYARLSGVQVGNHIQQIWLSPLSTEITAAMNSRDPCIGGVSVRADLSW